MGPRAALIVSMLVCVACGDTGGAFDMSVTADMALGGAGADMGSFRCNIPLTVTAQSDTLPTTLDVVASMADGAVNPDWQVLFGATSMKPTVGPTGLTASYVATQPGSYTFELSAIVNGTRCVGSTDYLVHNPMGKAVRYRFRALPPESLGVPLTDLPVTLYGHEMRDDINIALDPGTPIMGTLRGPGNATVAGEVRFIASLGPDAVTTTPSTGGFKLAVSSNLMYQPLFIPYATTLAPHLGASDLGINFAGQTFSVTAGEPVTGSVVDDMATGIGNARVVLRAGALPAGLGTTSSTGAFTLRAEQQTYAISVGADGWPIATAANVGVPGGGVTVNVAYSVARLAVGGSVTHADGTPVAGARVTISSRPLANVATLTVGAAAPRPMAGHVLTQVLSDATGHLPPLQLPAGTYDLIVEPPAGSAVEGLTAITTTLAAADSWTLALRARNTLTGIVTDVSGAPVAETQVTAMELAGLGSAPTTTTGSDGRYSLSVDSGAAFMLVFAPPRASMLAGVKQSLAAGSTRADVTLLPGLRIGGVVSGPSVGGEAAVIVEVLPADSSSDTPITSDITDKNGHYAVYIPDPGDVIVDGGAD